MIFGIVGPDEYRVLHVGSYSRLYNMGSSSGLGSALEQDALQLSHEGAALKGLLFPKFVD